MPRNERTEEIDAGEGARGRVNLWAYTLKILAAVSCKCWMLATRLRWRVACRLKDYRKLCFHWHLSQIRTSHLLSTATKQTPLKHQPTPTPTKKKVTVIFWYWFVRIITEKG
jgi:hypothetical protein